MPVRLLLVALLLTTVSCQSAYYATMERFGVHKREILVDRVGDARTSQQDAQQQFQTTFEAFQALTGFDGGDLEELYERLQAEYDDAEAAATDVRDEIDGVRHVAKAMFSEWEDEIAQISDPGLARRSRDLLEDTRDRYDGMVEVMQSAAERMDPVLRAFKDNVLFLKHNLNARAIDSLKETTLGIEGEVEELIRRMQVSIDEANRFIDSMES